jgi:SAM-dependent methyltransferase
VGERGDEPWYEAAFRDDYRRVYAHRDLESARPEAAFLLAQGLRGRVLDHCCGFGRHALLLSQAGLDVFGFDLSLDLLRAARELPGFAAALDGRLVRAEMTRVPFADASFDWVVNLFSSFGYLGEAGDARALREIARVLRPGAQAVLDLMNPPRVREGLVPHSSRSGPGFELEERRRLEHAGRNVVKEVELRRAGSAPRSWREEVRLYEPAELAALLDGAGLVPQREFGDFDGRPCDAGAPRRILVLRRGAV